MSSEVVGVMNGYSLISRWLIVAVSAAIACGAAYAFEIWFWPDASTALALKQFEPSEEAAATWREYSAIHAILPTLSSGSVVVIFLAMFLPGHEGRLDRLSAWF